MFSAAHVILPFADCDPAEAIRESLARFQHVGRRGLPYEWLTFEDETAALRRAHEALLSFTEDGDYGLKVEGNGEAHWYIDSAKVRAEMRRRGLPCWRVRFADTLDLDTFYSRYSGRMKRDPVTGGYGQWVNPLGRWDWWELGGRFDCRIIGGANRRAGRSVALVASGANPFLGFLAGTDDVLDQPPALTLDLLTDRNIEHVATLLDDLHAGRPHAFPATIVLPPGCVPDELRWLGAYDEGVPKPTLTWLGLPPEADWKEVVEASYTRFADHWVAGIAYHH